MKTVLFLLFVFGLTFKIKAQDHASATALVSVQIVKSLDVQKTSDLNFGKVVQNSGEVVVNAKDKRAGGFAVQGKPGANISVSLPKDIILRGKRGEELRMLSTEYSYNIKNDQNTSINMFNSSGRDITLNNKDGKLYIWYGGKINSNGAKKGVYNGTYTAIVAYMN